MTGWRPRLTVVTLLKKASLYSREVGKLLGSTVSMLLVISISLVARFWSNME
jgi:hypothetical protein